MGLKRMNALKKEDFCKTLLETINTIDDAVYLKDLKGKYIYVNDIASKLIGRPKNKVIGRSDEDIFPKEHLKKITELDEEVLASEQSVNKELTYKVNKQTYWFQTRLSPAYDEYRNLIGILGISRDVTDYKKLTATSEKQKKELEIILQNSTDAIFRKDLLGRYTFINKAGADFIKKPSREIIGLTDDDLFDEHTSKKIRKSDREILNKKTSERLVIKYADHDNDIWFDFSLSPALGSQQEVQGIIGVSKDITETKRLEMELRESNEQLLTILESSNDAIFAKDLEGKYLFINKACEEHVGKANADIVGKTDSDIFDSEISESIRAFEKQVIESKQANSTDDCFGKKGKESWYHSTISPAYSSSGELIGTIGISRNLTDYHKTQEELWKSENRYYSLYHDTPAIFLTLDADANVIEANTYGAKKLGYTIEELKQNSIYNIIPPEDKNIFRQELQKALNNPGTLFQSDRRYLSKDGKIIWGKDFIRVVYDKYGKASIPIMSEDKTDETELLLQLRHRDKHDRLTGLLNRNGFKEELNRAIQTAKDRNANHVMYFLELDNFKLVNDSCGHDAGDTLLIRIADLILNNIRSRDIAARVGGDKFAVLIENSDLVESEISIEKMCSLIRDYKYKYNDKLFTLSVSIGVIQISNDAEDAVSIMNKTEHAVSYAKDIGKNRMHIFNESDEGLQSRRLELEIINSVNQALENNSFELHAQKIIQIQTDNSNLDSYEILLRMRDNLMLLSSPGNFLPILESHHMIHQIDYWVVENLFKWMSQNNDKLNKVHHFSVNLSGQSLVNDELLDYICSSFSKYNISYNKICFEITETAAVTDINKAQEFINTLRNLGCLISLDDFGAGLSSFQYLRDLPVDFVKIDGAFIRNIYEDKSNYKLTEGIHKIVNELGIKTIAEYIESESVLEVVKEIGVDFGQGMHIHQPQNIETIFY